MQISAEDTQQVRQTLMQILGSRLSAAWIIGSRARGRARPGSDLDILVDTVSGLSISEQTALADAFEESDFSFHVDIVDGAILDPMVRQRMMARAVRLFCHQAPP